MEQQEAYERAWRDFLPKLQAVKSLDDALQLHGQAPPVGSPSRPFYSNFGFFLHYSSPPHGASSTELLQYLRILRCLRDEGSLKEEAFGELERLFKAASEYQ
ncbi:MAG TPA: hypothetical protein VGE27_03135 [Gemmatimonas sp.]|uniref:hypothetical protein n=1 Tax=Gemmatimonas sp. TaxID=1962908 RepID=UPI002ED8EACC